MPPLHTHARTHACISRHPFQPCIHANPTRARRAPHLPRAHHTFVHTHATAHSPSAVSACLGPCIPTSAVVPPFFGYCAPAHDQSLATCDRGVQRTCPSSAPCPTHACTARAAARAAAHSHAAERCSSLSAATCTSRSCRAITRVLRTYPSRAPRPPRGCDRAAPRVPPGVPPHVPLRTHLLQLLLHDARATHTRGCSPVARCARRSVAARARACQVPDRSPWRDPTTLTRARPEHGWRLLSSRRGGILLL